MDSRIWKVIVAVAALHVLVLGSMFLIQHGCKKTTPEMAKPEPIPMPAAPPIPPPGGVDKLPAQSYAPPVAPVTPVAPVPQVKTYTIKQGDTLGKIAKLEGVSVSDLTSANPGLDPKKLRIGQEIHVPSAGGTATGSETESVHTTTEPLSPPKATAASGVYTVKKGDTLAKIAKAKGTTVTALKKINGLSSDTIRVGQKLKIPTPGQSGQRPSREAGAPQKEATSGTVVEASGTTHIVQSGETPAIIAKKYGVTTKALLAANGNLDPRKLKIGQKLMIPGKAGEAAPSTEPAPPPAAPTDLGAPTGMPSPTDASATGGVSGSAVAPPTSTPAETPAPQPAPAQP